MLAVKLVVSESPDGAAFGSDSEAMDSLMPLSIASVSSAEEEVTLPRVEFSPRGAGWHDNPFC